MPPYCIIAAIFRLLLQLWRCCHKTFPLWRFCLSIMSSYMLQGFIYTLPTSSCCPHSCLCCRVWGARNHISLCNVQTLWSLSLVYFAKRFSTWLPCNIRSAVKPLRKRRLLDVYVFLFFSPNFNLLDSVYFYIKFRWCSLNSLTVYTN